MWRAILSVLSLFAGIVFGDCNLSANSPDIPSYFGNDSIQNGKIFNLDCCLEQTVSVETGGGSNRLALSALCPKTWMIPTSLNNNNSHAFSTLYLDQCFAFDSGKEAIYGFNADPWDPIHDVAHNITTACNFDKNSLSKTGGTWADKLRLAGTCNNHTVDYTINEGSIFVYADRLACSNNKVGDGSFGAFEKTGCDKYRLIKGNGTSEHLGALLGARCIPYLDPKHNITITSVLDIADCLASEARWRSQYDGQNISSTDIQLATETVKNCSTQNISLDPKTLQLHIQCGQYKNQSFAISEFVRSENGTLACYDVPGRLSLTPEEDWEMNANNITKRWSYRNTLAGQGA